MQVSSEYPPGELDLCAPGRNNLSGSRDFHLDPHDVLAIFPWVSTSPVHATAGPVAIIRLGDDVWIGERSLLGRTGVMIPLTLVSVRWSLLCDLDFSLRLFRHN